MEKARIVTFGCRLNLHEAQRIRDASQQAGLDGLEGGAIIFNTCAVTQEAVRQAKQAIRRAKKENPEARIIVTGCAAQTQAEDFASMEEVSLVLGNEEKLHAISYRKLPDFGVNSNEKIYVNDIMEVRENAPHMLSSFDGRTRAFVQVQNGCDHRCTFCIIPFGRGPSRSVPMGAVVEQIKLLCSRNYREVILTGVDLTSYGADLPGNINLAHLVEAILRHVPELERLRLSSIDSIEANEHLIDLLVHEHRIMPHLHLSLQSGDDLILKRMKRRHLRKDAIKFCETLLKQRSEFVFGADLIVGFPTETEEMFMNTRELVQACSLTHLHVFPYSIRANTPAARMPQVPRSIIKERASILRMDGAHAYSVHLKKQIGARKKLLMEKPDLGRCEDYTLAQVAPGAPIGEIISCSIIGEDQSKLIATRL